MLTAVALVERADIRTLTAVDLVARAREAGFNPLQARFHSGDILDGIRVGGRWKLLTDLLGGGKAKKARLTHARLLHRLRTAAVDRSHADIVDALSAQPDTTVRRIGSQLRLRTKDKPIGAVRDEIATTLLRRELDQRYATPPAPKPPRTKVRKPGGLPSSAPTGSGGRDWLAEMDREPVEPWTPPVSTQQTGPAPGTAEYDREIDELIAALEKAPKPPRRRREAVDVVRRATEAGFNPRQARWLVDAIFGGEKVGGRWKPSGGSGVNRPKVSARGSVVTQRRGSKAVVTLTPKKAAAPAKAVRTPAKKAASPARKATKAAPADQSRPVARILADLDEATWKDASPSAVEHRIRSAARRDGLPTDLVDNLVAAGVSGDRSRISSVLDRVAAEHGLTRLSGPAGSVERFDATRHKMLPGLRRPAHGWVRVFRAGYADRDGTVLDRAVVDVADPPAGPAVSKVAGARKAAPKALSERPHYEQVLARDLVRRHATGESVRQLAANTANVSEAKVRELLKAADVDVESRKAFARQAGMGDAEAAEWARDPSETMAQLRRRLTAAVKAVPSSPAVAKMTGAGRAASKQRASALRDELQTRTHSDLVSVAHAVGIDAMQTNRRDEVTYFGVVPAGEGTKRLASGRTLASQIAKAVEANPSLEKIVREHLAATTPRTVRKAPTRRPGAYDISSAVPARRDGSTIRWAEGTDPGWDAARTARAGRALRAYREHSFEINSTARGRNLQARIFPEELTTEHIEALDDLLAASRLTEPVESWRGVYSRQEMFGTDGDLTGHEWVEDAFTSTSLTRDISELYATEGGRGVLMRVSAPAGVGAAQVQNSRGESEILFQRRLRMRVTADHGIQPGTGYRLVDVEAVPIDSPRVAGPAVAKMTGVAARKATPRAQVGIGSPGVAAAMDRLPPGEQDFVQKVLAGGYHGVGTRVDSKASHIRFVAEQKRLRADSRLRTNPNLGTVQEDHRRDHIIADHLDYIADLIYPRRGTTSRSRPTKDVPASLARDIYAVAPVMGNSPAAEPLRRALQEGDHSNAANLRMRASRLRDEATHMRARGRHRLETSQPGSEDYQRGQAEIEGADKLDIAAGVFDQHAAAISTPSPSPPAVGKMTGSPAAGKVAKRFDAVEKAEELAPYRRRGDTGGHRSAARRRQDIAGATPGRA